MAEVCAVVTWLPPQEITDVPELNADSLNLLASLEADFCEEDAKEVKDIEAVTNHDVKAVEYFLRSKVWLLTRCWRRLPSRRVWWCMCVFFASLLQFSNSKELRDITHFIHFALTSEDVNNIAYGRMIKGARDSFLLPLTGTVIEQLEDWADEVCLVVPRGCRVSHCCTPPPLPVRGRSDACSHTRPTSHANHVRQGNGELCVCCVVLRAWVHGLMVCTAAGIDFAVSSGLSAKCLCSGK